MNSNGMKTLYYIANMRMPTQKAHGRQVIETCAAFARQGITVTLVVPRRFNSLWESVFEYFGVKETFSVRFLPTIDLIRFGIPGAFVLQTFTFGISIFFFLFAKPKGTIVYTRGEMGSVLSFFPSARPLIWETHSRPNQLFWYRHLFRVASTVIPITHCYEKELQEFGIEKERILVSPDGVDIKHFAIDKSKESARKKLSLPLDKKLILYAGSALVWKGVEILSEAADFLPDSVLVLMIGLAGENTGRVSYMGRRPYSEVPLWLAAADALVLTGTLKDKMSSCYTSPLKLFEYMASGRPIVAPKLPSFTEILNEGNALLVTPDDSSALFEGIIALLSDSQKSEALATQARKDVEQYSWDARARRISDFAGTRIESS